ncbi:MBL fold metallo-hydrolase [Halosolutus amylolyticus]|uniref:MBL fold metallo-hydrolase n=1 Tax=Halosolutus amylolyticus TaxID=2932267 RepID=A0ABD5PLZ4_9EURY|nr:MBL fold metallo-hydrolase [Halosolutus amylolyticus]
MFDRRSIPTPFPVGDVNTYLAGRTIVDPGPDSDEAWDEVRSFLSVHDLEPGDIEQVLLTHSHPDHFGLAKRFRDRGATVAASPPAAAVVEDFGARLDAEAAFFRDLFPAHGMDADAAATITDLSSAYRSYAPDCVVDRRLTDGDTIEVGPATLSVQQVSGHAAGELILSVESASRGGVGAPIGDGGDRAPEAAAGTTAIVGDHVLEHITPNPLLRPPVDDGVDRPQPLLEFNASLLRLRDRGFDRLLPGHGGIIDEPAERIAEVLAAHEDRTENVASILDEGGEATAHEVMEGLFGELSLADQYTGMSEAIGHLDVLVDRGRARRVDGADRITYEPA